MLSFLVKFWTDRKTDRRTLVKQYAPALIDVGALKEHFCTSAGQKYKF